MRPTRRGELAAFTLICAFAFSQAARSAPPPAAEPKPKTWQEQPLDDERVRQANLKKYVADGGTLLADAAGGSKSFAESFDKLAGQLFGPLVMANPPWLKDVVDDKGAVHVRHIDNLRRVFRPIHLLGWQKDGRWAVLSLPYDLSAAMAAYPNIEPVGLTPISAEKLVAAMIKSLSGATTKPAN
ncbi:MAG: hypothetical protein PHU85_10520 [Phycisphaerae bacterium]|nr:hypothetical protein [Phycisphaerae bacterium]